MKERSATRTEIGACEARTRWPELLREVKAGRRFTITNRGEAIADLVPSTADRPADATTAIEWFRAFMRENPVRKAGSIEVRALIEESRK